eukprot:CAMPEP_0181304788 /NCGR_PEP_ID=MMETSP1101-20121128/9353_1 /TAXON_ID=46948 /ORGANISM="Rhodomonas abbreviata, Strain Caron Lab Isolate" /LENGTH=1307 /DNA_ID=CAMNT_0023410601 /DNA_START=14 /DNA_END=3937 /DNA_ORIENTATION=-
MAPRNLLVSALFLCLTAHAQAKELSLSSNSQHPVSGGIDCGEGKQLVTIKSAAEQQEVLAWAAQESTLTSQNIKFAFIGLWSCAKAPQAGLTCPAGAEFVWSDGTALDRSISYHAFNPSCSNGAVGPCSGDPYVGMYYADASGVWERGNGYYYGICETVSAACDETAAANCHELAYCQNDQCVCPEGMIGDGVNKCDTEGWTVRTLYTSCAAPLPGDMASLQGSAEAVVVDFASGTLEVNQLYSKDATLPDVSTPPTAVTVGGTTCQPWSYGSRIYTWNAGTSSGEARVLPTGLTLDSVAYASTCTDSPAGAAGCWVIGVTYTTGGDEAFNAFYFPHMVGNDALSYNFNYAALSNYGSFDPVNFPIQTDGRTDKFDEFIADYRPTQNFVAWAGPAFDDDDDKRIDRPNYDETENGAASEVAFPSTPEDFLDGAFKGLTRSPGVVNTTLEDPFFFQYKAVIEIEELDLRQLAGKMKGTASVEYTVDSFLGYVNFRPTGLETVDTMATQTALHMEKTSFFSVSTHGTNDYTFLEYVNLRLVSVLDQDTDTSDETAGETTSDMLFTDGTDSAVYVQVTFTLGSQYRPNENEGLIPLTSVRTGKGDFMSTVDGIMDHSCAQWAKGAGSTQDFTTSPSYPAFSGYSDFAQQTTFETRLAQTCAPGGSMCEGPLLEADLPDQFVSFNIPLGIDYLGVDQSDASPDLSMNVFVDMVISAVDNTASVVAGDPNEGGAAQQMKTTLTASIPVVDGGVNLFCDGVVAKTDLKDVAKATLIIGTASTPAELLRLTIFEDIANSAMSPQDPSEIATDSIEASLMTLVIEGTTEYFSNTGSGGYFLELEDVITVHVMDPARNKATGAGVVFDKIKGFLAEDGADNDQGSGIDTDGYALNGAFYFRIDRAYGRAHLEPSTKLLGECPFNPTRPLLGGSSCVTRRDVRYRDFPARVGGSSTAMEISIADGDDMEARFMQTVLGGSDYAAKLGRDYADVIHKRYLVGDGVDQYNRAWWINPGYEWTPTQTGGESIFSLSQQIIMFALINLNEVYIDGGDRITPSIQLPAGKGSTFSTATRRMLLSNVEEDQGTTAMSLSFDVNPVSLMAQALDVPEERVGLFEVDVTLTQAEACMSIDLLSQTLSLTFEDYLSTTASHTDTVQVVSVNRDMGQETCGTRRRLLAAFSSASAKVQMLVAFTEGIEAKFNIAKFAEMPGIEAVAPAANQADFSDVGAAIDVDDEFETTREEQEKLKNALNKAPEEGGSDNTTVIIAAAAGGVGALVLAGVAFFMYKRSQGSQEPEMVTTVGMTVHELKAQMQDDM